MRDLLPRVEVKVIGPFLGVSPEGAMRIFIALPDQTHLDELTCVVWRQESMERGAIERHEILAEVDHKPWRLFSFAFSGLIADAIYSYRFEGPSGVLALEGGLTEADCAFRAPGAFTDTDSFILMSCHDPFQKQPYPDAGGWDMWPKVLDVLKSDPSVRFLVLGGDQLYNDDVEAECLDGLKDAGTENFVRKRFFRQYQKYWGNLDYRRVLARLPSVAMWDDHDITDGWGGRPDSFAGEEFSDRWKRYFGLATEAFISYQACRNPPALIPGDGPFTTFFDFGENRLYLMDFRFEKAAQVRRLWKPAHEDAFMESLRTTPPAVRRVFILSPVVPVRTAPNGDHRLHALSLTLFQTNRWLRRRKSRLWAASLLWGAFGLAALLAPRGINTWNAYIVWLGSVVGLTVCLLPIAAAWLVPRIPELPDLADDLEDGLSSECNREALVRLLRAAFNWQIEHDGQVVLLSGDIHAAGITEILDSHSGAVQAIPQIVSSPISYAPMPKVVAGLTTSTSEIVLGEDGGCRMVARNILYTSRRNFAQVFPARMAAGGGSAVLFHLERHQAPIALPIRFLPRSPAATGPRVDSA